MLDCKLFKAIPDWIVSSQWVKEKFIKLNGEELRVKDYGVNSFHGRTHPAIAYMGVTRFTNEEDLVYIPFAGSGTEVDICKELKRRFVAVDLSPIRDDIKLGDATIYTLEEKAKLIIAHPPYEDVIRYGNKSGSNLSFVRGVEYKYLVSLCSGRFWNSLVVGGRVLVIIGSTYNNQTEHPLDYIWWDEMIKVGFRLIGRIVRDFGETKGTGNTKNLWKYRLLKWGRFRLENDFVLVFEK